MQIYDLLMKDHDKVQDLMARLVELGDDDFEQARELVSQVAEDLIPHARAEEAVFYNSIRAINTVQDLVWHGFEEHMAAEALLRTLQAATKIDADFKATAKKLQQALDHHINEEENKFFVVARQLFTEREAEVMGEAFEEMKPQVAEGGIVQSTLDMVANMLPPRLAAPLRTYTYRV